MKFLIKYLVLLIAFFTMISCSIIASLYISNGSAVIKTYSFVKNTKEEVNIAIKYLFENNRKYITPIEFNTVHNYSDLSTKEARKWNSDSVNFYFSINYQGKDIIYWTRFVGLEDNWNVINYEYGIACELSLKAIYIDNEIVLNKDSNGKKELENLLFVELFESEILTKIKDYLVEYPRPEPKQESK